MPNPDTTGRSWRLWAQRSKGARYAAILTGLIAAVGAAFVFADRRPLPVTVASIEQRVPIKVYGLGTIEARILSEVGFEVGAALDELKADHGDRVSKGQVLARLHSAEQDAKSRKAAAGVINAEAALKAAQTTVARAQAILEQKEAINRRRKELLGRQITSIEAAEEAEKEEIVARADVASASANVEVARAHLEDARAQHAYEKVLLDHHVLVAPYDALVVRRHKELGAVLKAGEILFTLIDAGSVWALAYIDEARAGDISLGQPAEVRLRSRPRDLFRARVARIGIESDRVSEERRVYLACEQCPETVHLGEQIEVFITTGTIEEALLVPEHAVQGFDGASGSVWTVEEGRLRLRHVEFSARTLDGRLVVASSIPKGAQVVTSVPKGAREGRWARLQAGGTP